MNWPGMVAEDAPPQDAFDIRYDYDGSNNLIYEGWAAPGSLTTDAVWAIRKMTYTGTNVVLKQWANGNTAQANVWNNRASLTYL